MRRTVPGARTAASSTSRRARGSATRTSQNPARSPTRRWPWSGTGQPAAGPPTARSRAPRTTNGAASTYQCRSGPAATRRAHALVGGEVEVGGPSGRVQPVRRLMGSPYEGGSGLVCEGARQKPAPVGGAAACPSSPLEKYAQMLDAAKENAYAYPAINVSSSQTLNAALAGFAEAGSDGIVQVSTGGAEYLGSDDQGHGGGLGRVRGVRARGGQELPGQHRPPHRPLPREQARRVRPPAALDLRGARGPG